MEIHTKTIQQITVVEISGDLDGTSAPVAQAEILPRVTPGAKLILDMSGVAYMSSAGLRMLLATYRTIASKGGEVALVGLSEELADTMSLTGFLDFFTHFDSLDAGLAGLA